MSKNILVLTGSPRRGGNSDLLADAFIKGAEAAGNIVTKYEAGTKNIGGCKACDGCYSEGDACVFDDDFNSLAPLMEQSDVLVIVTPLYWFTFSAQIKAALDRMYALVVGERAGRIKGSVLLTCGETSAESDFNGMIKSYELIAAYQKWTDLGRLVVTSVLDKGDILKTDALQKAEALGLTVK